MNSVEFCVSAYDSVSFEADDDILDRLLWWLASVGIVDA